MRRRTAVVLILGLFSAVAARADEATKKDQQQFQGTWTTVSAEMNGDKLDDDIVKALKFVVKGDKFDVEGPPVVLQQYAKGTFKMEATTKPKTIDVKVGEGEMKGDVIEGIYEFDDDTLKICAKLSGKERPADFTTKAGSNMVSLVLKREKK